MKILLKKESNQKNKHFMNTVMNQSSMVKNEQQILADLNDLSNLQALNARLRATMSKEEINLLDEEIKSSEEDFN